MLSALLDILHCPGCGEKHRLFLQETVEKSGEEIITGTLGCEHCPRTFPIHNGILDMAGKTLGRPHLSQRLMEWLPIVRIYEKSWRPTLVRSIQAGLGFDEEVRLVERMLKPEVGDVMLDLACGPGNYTRRWARVVHSGQDLSKPPKKPQGLVIGVDRSLPMLNEAVKQTKAAGIGNVSYIRCDGHRLPLDSGKLNGASCCAALHLFENPGEAMQEIGRGLKRGGRFVCLTVHTDDRDYVRWMQQGSELLTGLHFFSREEMDRLCKNASLEFLEDKHMGPIWLFAARR